MKVLTILGTLAAVLAVAAGHGGRCPKEQEANWMIEHLLEHPRCDKFYKCTYGQPVEQDCPPGLFFNVEKWECLWPYETDCGDRWRPEVESNENSSGYGNSNENGIGNGSSENNGNGSGENSGKGSSENSGNGSSENSGKGSNENNGNGNGSNENSGNGSSENNGNSSGENNGNGKGSNENTGNGSGENNGNGKGSNENNGNGKGSNENSGNGSNENSGNGSSENNGNDKGSNENNGNGSNESGENRCKSPFIEHNDCDKFYQCTNGKLVEIKCPPNLWFNIELGACDWPINIDCGDRWKPGQPRPDSNENSSIDSSSGSSSSSSSESSSSSSESNSSSSESSSSSSEENKSNSNSNSSEEDSSNIEFLPNGCPVDGHVHLLLPHKYRCDQFYNCVWGKKVREDCPGKLHFNAKLQVCDWPEHAGCRLGFSNASKN